MTARSSRTFDAIRRRWGASLLTAALAATAIPPATTLAADTASAPGDGAAPAVRPAAGERAPLTPFGTVRALEGDESSQAVEARDAADRLRAEHEHRYRLGKAPRNKDKAADADFQGVVTAYRAASSAHPATEIDCYCRLRLAGAYQYRGEFDKALDEAKQAAELFAGTGPGLEAEQAVGLIYLQALHQPRDAEMWFRRLQADAAIVQDVDAQQKWGAAAAQGLARCQEESAAAAKERKGPKAAKEEKHAKDGRDREDVKDGVGKANQDADSTTDAGKSR